MATVSGASIVAVTAVYGAFDFKSNELLYIGAAAFSFFVCAAASLLGLKLAFNRLLSFAWGETYTWDEHKSLKENLDSQGGFLIGQRSGLSTFIYIAYLFGLGALAMILLAKVWALYSPSGYQRFLD